MSNDRKQVLEMLAAGKITAEEAERLLERLAAAAGGSPDAQAKESASLVGRKDGRELKFMCIHVDSDEGDKVDVRVPIGLLRTGIKLSAMLPKEAAEAMSHNGVDFSQLSALSGGDLMDALRDMTVDVQAADGTKVQVYCE
jgi:hypothetical protein